MSTLLTRSIVPFIVKDLTKKMVFLGGPRQVGKTTLAQALIHKYKDGHPAYLNWDLAEHRKKIKEKNWPNTEKLIVLDEVHKYKSWQNLIKGYYDTLKNTHSFLVTGSARLDRFRKGGDSLLGRYHYYRLHPYSLDELGFDNKNLERLMKFGGFPEPLFEQNETTLRRWHAQRVSRLIKDDLRDLETVKDLDKVETLAEMLPNKVGSQLSIKSLAEDLEIDFKTAKRWLKILDSLYYCYLIAPYGAPKVRAIKKEQKLYLWDWSQVDNLGSRFENLVASHLLKYCHFVQDTEGYKMELRYLRDTDKREIDFVVIRNKEPLFAVEAKYAEKDLSPHIKYFSERTIIPQFYQVHSGTETKHYNNKITLMPFVDFCKQLSNY